MRSARIASANFGFLQAHDPLLDHLGALAERYFRDDPSTCLLKLRQFGEVLAQRTAANAGKRQLIYWVGTENGRAVAFASGFGFRPTGHRRPMRVVSEDDGEEELAMTLPLAGDRGGIASW